MRYENEFPIATGPTKSSYSPGEEQAQRMAGHLGPELNRRLEIAAAKMEILKKFKDYIGADFRLKPAYTYSDIVSVIHMLEQEIKAELKGEH